MAAQITNSLSSRSTTGPPQHRSLGEIPSLLPDVPINSAFLSLFILGAIAHYALFHYNLRRSLKFLFNAATSAFCITRIIATILRMAWAGSPDRITLAIATEIFIYAGSAILIITNLFWTVRFVRAQHPHFGWSKSFSSWLPLWLVICSIALLCLMVSIPAEAYLLDPHAQKAARQLQLFGAAIFAVSGLLPILILTISAVAKTHPSLKDLPSDHFGQSTLTHKLLLILTTSILLSIGAVFRAATIFIDPPSTSTSTPWYLTRAPFYIFNFTLDFLLTTLFLLLRVDKHLLIPNAAHGPMSYGVAFLFPPRPSHESHYSTSTLPPPSPASTWRGSLRNYMTDSNTSHPSHLRAPISRLQTPEFDVPRHPEMIHKKSKSAFVPRRFSRGTSFSNSSVTAIAPPSRRKDSAYDAGGGGSRGITPDVEDMRNFPLAIKSVDLKRATAGALKQAAGRGGIRAGLQPPARWQERFAEERRPRSEYSCRTNLQVYTPRV
ncbi:unnamed protein product [Zymoseptoria tritici ST99CH_1E4]|uniref:Uncharacterized protein n=1 Tax=Zymoseptoria tritici ST99CH_1E4 TaxID=1276532 RepID=A0A2H1GXJ2_ZYMTR|nr:unnamed protein product [Zymoseptoria tritici ST99CH_1E4]